MRNKVKLTFSALLAALLWFAIAMQFYISVPNYLAHGRTTGGAIVQLLSYFTIQNNFLLALLLTLYVFAPKSKWGLFFAEPAVVTAMTVYISVVGLVYHFMLRDQFHGGGMLKLTNDIFHVVSPVAFVLYWALLIEKKQLQWRYAITWLIYPFIYFIYVMIRGGLSDYYPYNFLDVNKTGIRHVAITFVFLFAGFVFLNALFIFISRSLVRTHKTERTL